MSTTAECGARCIGSSAASWRHAVAVLDGLQEAVLAEWKAAALEGSDPIPPVPRYLHRNESNPSRAEARLHADGCALLERRQWTEEARERRDASVAIARDDVPTGEA